MTFSGDRDRLKPHRADSRLNQINGNPEIDEGAQRHIATDAAETVEIRDFHRQSLF
jgi:hypothetical protein